ncbi:MAG: hypothetical protein LBE74_02855 [Treponema sp.]|nr:hypothetical protein [Treponema sp.]
MKMLVVVLTLVSCSKPLWLADQGLDEKWASIARTGGAPFTETALFEGTPPKNRYGFIVTETRPDSAREADDPTFVYPALYQTGQYEDSIVLALDPWVVFHEFTDSSLTRARAENPGQGFLILPGAEEDARLSWTAQFAQPRPGAFSAEEWARASETLFTRGQFQDGARTYNWINAWEVFFERSPSWIYAPYSAVRAMPPVRTAGFEARRFPIPADWESYGVQAEVLWAIPFFKNAKEEVKLETAKAWLVDADTQKRIADALNRLPASSGVPPTNALARAVQTVCARAEFVWTMRAFEK